MKDKTDILTGKGNHGNLGCYISRISYYPLLYNEPLYCYLMTKDYFKTLNLLPTEYKKSTAIWNMKRVPNDMKDSEYPIIPNENRIFIYDGYTGIMNYLNQMFKKLIENDFKENPINSIILGSTKTLSEIEVELDMAIQLKDKDMIYKRYEEYLSKGGLKELDFFKEDYGTVCTQI